MRVAPGAMHIQPLRGWGPSPALSPGCTWGYSYSTPTGLWPLPCLPQVPPGAIHIQPLRGCGPPRPFPQVPPGAIHIQPLRGWGPINS